MSASVENRGFTAEAFEAFLADRREPEWLLAMRREAWSRFEATPLPDRTLEEWRRTDIRAFHLESFGVPQAAGGSAKALLSEGVDLSGSLTPTGARLDPDLARQGVLLGRLDQLASTHGDLLRSYLYRAVDGQSDKFAALHAACWSGGMFLYVPKGVAVERPIHALASLAPGGVEMGHILIVLDEGAEATVLLETASLDPGDCPHSCPDKNGTVPFSATGLHCGATEVFLGPKARLHLVGLQNWGEHVWQFAHEKAILAAGAHLQWTLGALGAHLAKVNQHVVLAGPDAKVEVNGVMFTEGRRHLSYHTLQHHQAPRCTSDFLYKGALQDNSRLVWRGMIKVDPDAQQTDGYQRNDNLMLSEDARADCIPGLEIEADDVKCSHGATAGRVDDEQVFYASCRGLTHGEAVRMIVTGFFQQVFDRISVESVRQALGEAIKRRVRDFE